MRLIQGMLAQVVLASLIAAGSAAPQPVLFAIDHHDGARVASSIVLLDTGEWTANGRSGHLSATQLAKVRAQLERAPWRLEHSEISCMAISQSYTDYFVRGKLVWSAHVCGRERLDPSSLKSLSEVEQVLVSASA